MCSPSRVARHAGRPGAFVRGLIASLLALAGCGRFSFDNAANAQRFVDDAQGSFDHGSYDTGAARLAWQGDRIALADPPPYTPAMVGIYLSRPLDAGDPRTVWRTLAWSPIAPAGKPLPDGGASDVGYAEGTVDMTANHLLLHLDGAGDAANGDEVTDASGLMHHGQIVLAGEGARYLPGVFGQAGDLDRDAWVHLDGTMFDFGTGDFTYSIWVRMFDCSLSNDNRIAMGGAGSGDNPHMWLGALCPDSCPGGDGAFMNFLDSTRVGGSISACSGVRLDDGGWHHLAGVKQGHTSPAAALRLYVDGREVGTSMFDYGSGTFDYDGGEIRLGSFNLGDPQYNTRIVVDEAAQWKRALSADEIAAVYRRGAVHVELQFRVCPDRVCDDEPFVGPDGTSASVFTEADLVGPPGTQHDNLVGLGLVGPVAQYKVRFQTAFAPISPGLASVVVEADRP